MTTRTILEASSTIASTGGFVLKGASFPKKIPPRFMDQFEKLTSSQAGHLRHFHNLTSQPDGEWHLMGSQEPAQEWLDAYRYQIATMAYAAGVAHYHRLPALRSVFKTLFDQIMHKMLRREVWGYWFVTSHSGKFVDPGITELRHPWADPVKRENIMYSGHLLLMVSLYSMLFNDDKYDEPDALVFDWDPIFWGMGPEKFYYNRTSLQQVIVSEMERENWLGVCCEPNNIFIVCNQFPIIAMRYNDVRKGTNIVDGVLEKYTSAWKEKGGMTQENGLYYTQYTIRQGVKIPSETSWSTAWASAFMNSWNSAQVHAAFPSQSLGFFTYVSKDRVNLHGPAIAYAIRDLSAKENADPHASTTLQKAREIAAAAPVAEENLFKFGKPEFGYVVHWVSEVGDPKLLDGLLNHADSFMNPCWEQGGLFYRRNSEMFDQDGNWTMVDPFTGNAAIGYARLNVSDGQKKMWDKPWTSEDVSSRPYLDGINLSGAVDFLRGSWDPETGVMIVTMRTWDGSKTRIRPIFRNLPVGNFGIYINGEFSETRTINNSAETVELEVEVGESELDLVLLSADWKSDIISAANP